MEIQQKMEKTGFLAGLIGFVLLIAGVALISIAAALITAGLLLLGWSALLARSIAIANHRSRHDAAEGN